MVAGAHAVGHEGIQKTLHRLKADFHTPCMRAVVQEHIASCTTCQRNKSEHLYPASLLQTLHVPSHVWTDISMDFVEGLPKVHGRSLILSLGGLFLQICTLHRTEHPYSAYLVTAAFFADIVRLHGIPASIVSDHDPKYTRQFWQLFRLPEVRLHMSSAIPSSMAKRKLLIRQLPCTCVV